MRLKPGVSDKVNMNRIQQTFAVTAAVLLLAGCASTNAGDSQNSSAADSGANGSSAFGSSTTSSTGTTGSTGTANNSGTTGSTGMTSGNGTTGSTGTAGYTGTTGNTGSAGSSGTTGYTGTSSSTGTNSGSTSSGSTANGSSGTTGSTAFAGSNTTGGTYGGDANGMTSSAGTGPYGGGYGGGTRGFYGRRRGSPMMGVTLAAVNASFGRGNASDVIGGTTTTGGLGADYRDANGVAIGLTPFFGTHFGLDFGAAYIKPRVNFTPAAGGFGTITGGRVRMIPLTALAQWHFLPHSFIDPYVGGGAAYVLMRDATGFTAGTGGTLGANGTGLQNVNYSNQFGGALQAGVIFGFRSFGLNIDAKYLPLNSRGTATFGTTGGGTITGSQGTTRLNPLMIGAGLTFGF
jgi:collagen type VII alpha